MTQSELPAALEDKVRYRWDHFSESTVGRWLECRVERLPERGVKRESVVPLHDLLHCLKTSTRTTRQRVQGRRIGNGDDRDVIFLVSHEPNCALHIFDGSGIVKSRGGPMVDGKHGVSRLQQRRTPDVDLLFLQACGAICHWRLPAATGNENYTTSIRLGWVMDIH